MYGCVQCSIGYLLTSFGVFFPANSCCFEVVYWCFGDIKEEVVVVSRDESRVLGWIGKVRFFSGKSGERGVNFEREKEGV